MIFRGILAVGAVLFTLFALLLIEPQAARSVVRYGGYYFTLAGAAAFVVYLVRSFYPCKCSSLRLRKHLIGIVSVLIGSWFLFVHADFGYKIAMDEYLLVGTARSMHLDKEVAVAEEGSFFGNTFKVDKAMVDKRPWFYPFVVSCLHDLVGYRDANPYIVNASAAVLFLGGVYLFGYLLVGPMAGALSVLLWSSLPLLAQNATGAGMEMLNLLMFQVVVLLAVLYLRRPSSSFEGALSLAAVLLTYTRYESGLFVIPVAIVILLGWYRERRILLSWGSVLAAPLLIGVVFQTSIYAVTESSWEMMPGASAPFGLNNVAANLPHALNFFFSLDDSLANSLLLSALGVPAVVGFFVLARRELGRYWSENIAAVVTLLFGLFLLLHLGVILSFHASQLDAPYVSRYALPIHWILIFALIVTLSSLQQRWPKVWVYCCGITFLFILTFTLPMNAKAIFSKSNFRVRELNWLEAVGDVTFKPRSLVIDRITIPWTLNDYAAITPEMALQNAGRITNEVVTKKYSEVFLVERMHYEGNQFVADFSPMAGLHEVFKMELVEQRSFRPFELTRLYRLKGYTPK